MNLEEKKVLRKDILSNLKNKEWWYTGIYEEEQDIYISFFFCRVPYIDKFKMTIFDRKKKEPFVYERKLFLDNSQENGKLDLKKTSKNFNVSYWGDEKKGWVFNLSDKNICVNISAKPSKIEFTKFDNKFRVKYSLLHFMQNQIKGEINVKTDKYEILRGLGYYDHCFGIVPSKTGWHWLAVQNSKIALVSLVNYGQYAQKCTQVLINKPGLKDKWIRLNQDVSFEYLPRDKYNLWRVTSCDINLKVSILMASESKEKIPPIFPFVVNLQHDEYFVRVTGYIKVDNEWIDIGELHGALEEHFGKW